METLTEPVFDPHRRQLTARESCSVVDRLDETALNEPTDWLAAHPRSSQPAAPRCGGGAGPLSSCRSAFSKAWLKEFWKLGTGTRSDPSLSPSLSAARGASSVSVAQDTIVPSLLQVI
ncbi:hypothetical protein EYF80_019097 [Liparis tanakae]|uniref:Uncharacterized protein n=1 Tax=Liparis tanakae TaxID=230148 RepID=A0A4Z2HYP2_9TELE|nr:hypothetical protein EYF80_019097 [Liparis tanakae]